MRWLKKFLRIIAILLPCFVALSISAPSFAKSYDITGFNVYPFAFYDPNHSSSNLGKVPVQSPLQIYLNDLTDVNARRISVLSSTYNSSTDKCVFTSGSDYINTTYYGSNYIQWGQSLLIPKIDVALLARNDTAICHTLFPYGHKTTNDVSLTPDYVFSSTFPYADTLPFTQYLPYNQLYSTINFDNSREVNGVDYNSKFYLSDLLNSSYDTNSTDPRDSNYKYYSNRITQAILPLNFDSTLEEIESGNTITIIGQVNNISSAPYLYGHFVDPSNYSQVELHSQCAFIDYTSSIKFACRLDAPFTTNMYGFDLYLVNPNGLNNFTSTIAANSVFCDSSTDSSSCPISFSSFRITLNGDSTEGGNGSLATRGNFPNVAPGMPQPEDSSNADWYSSLVNQFVFSFTNPFQPIFNLFTSGDQCSQIPIIAGMLHSDQTTYCPWFDSSVRNILTPVFSLASVMLVFGFLVRWLGSSSGNMFDDQTGGGALGKGTFVGRSRK